MRPTKLALMIWTASTGLLAPITFAQTIDLYVDTKTQQLFAQPGPGRVKLGTFKQIDEAGEKALASQASPTPATTATATTPAPAVAATPTTSSSKKWYDRLALRGYMQLRYNEGVGGDADDLRAPGDRFIGKNQNLGIRRARLVVSGDVSDNVSIYLQPDFASTPSGSSTGNFAQLRDAYADIYFDEKKEFRVRAGQSKVPYGWEDLQSSQNRIAPDRADALNSAVRDERDLGMFFYYSPSVAKERFAYLVKSGLKGSGDYGVVGLGVYNGQGANRVEQNDSMHTVLHLTYPFKFANGQFFEVGADAYSGRFKVATPTAVTIDGTTFVPKVDAPPSGSIDQRVAVHAIYYPQPFGFQAEWTVGRGPELDIASKTIRTKSLRGGYVQAMYKMDGSYGTILPYVKWQTYNGASKFDTNTPAMLVNDLEFGAEWQPNQSLEIALLYANMRRTNVSAAPYARVKGDLIRLQLQVNY